MKFVKKRIAAIMAAAAFALGIVCGSLFSNYIPIKPVEIKKYNSSAENSKKISESSAGSMKESSAEEKNENTVQTSELGDEEIEKKAKEILLSMTLDEKIYQMMFVTPESITGVGTCIQAGNATKEALGKYPVGGIIYFKDNVIDKAQLTKMIENTQSYSKIPLFIGVDEEGGSVRRLGEAKELNMTEIGDMSKIGESGDTSESYNAAKTIAGEISSFGFNVDFAPVCDVLLNSENTVVKKRSFGGDTDIVSKMALSFVLGLQDNGVSACLKHFPGHGATSGDTHDGYSVNKSSSEDVLEKEVKAFESGINHGCDFVMMGHISVPSLTESDIPCSLSEKIVTRLLKEELGFNGIAITDAMNMGAVSDNYSCAQSVVEAVKAGIDMILMPTDVSQAFEAVKQQVGDGIDEKQIDESVLRILKTKIRRNIINI